MLTLKAVTCFSQHFSLQEYLRSSTSLKRTLTDTNLVANIATTAIKSKDGKHYIVNGTKKWITNGIWSDYATMVVRTGGPGASGLSMLICPLLNTPRVSMRRLKVAGQVSAGTTFIELDDVKVPVENLIGDEGAAMKCRSESLREIFSNQVYDESRH